MPESPRPEHIGYTLSESTVQDLAVHVESAVGMLELLQQEIRSERDLDADLVMRNLDQAIDHVETARVKVSAEAEPGQEGGP